MTVSKENNSKNNSVKKIKELYDIVGEYVEDIN